MKRGKLRERDTFERGDTVYHGNNPNEVLIVVQRLSHEPSMWVVESESGIYVNVLEKDLFTIS